MKSLLYYTIVIMICVSSTYTLCMNNSYIGPVDTLMLQDALSQRGFDLLDQEVQNHHFKVPYENIAGKFEYPNPYMIERRCLKRSDSALSQEVFSRIKRTTEQDMAVEVDNYNNSHFDNGIDECTAWEKTDNESEVKCVSRFFNKAALLALLHQLRK